MQRGLPSGFAIDPETGDLLRIDKDAGELRKVCSPIEVFAKSRDKLGDGWSHAVRIVDSDGIDKEVLLPWRDLRVTNGDRDPVSILSDQGLILAPWGRASDLRDFLNASRPTRIARRIDRAGWQEGGAAFALPSQIIGSGKEELLWAGKQTHAAAAYAKAGTLDQWQATIAVPAASHP